MSAEERYQKAKEQQDKGKAIEELEKEGMQLGSTEPTEYAKSARYIVEKNQSPETLEEQIYQSNIPKSLLPNVLMLHSTNKAIDNLTKADVTLYNPKTGRVTLYNNDDSQEGHLVKFRTISIKGYNKMKYWGEFWHQTQAGLYLALPAVEGGVRKDGVRMVEAITNSERSMLEAQNNMSIGVARKGWNWMFGSGKGAEGK